MVSILDDFLGRKLLSLSGKARGAYGSLGATELKPWGFEYRTLPSAWLYNPEISEIVLKIAQGTLKKFLEEGELKYETDEAGAKKKEYLKFISKDEREKFFTFIENYPHYSGEPINANWGGEYQVTLLLRDSWDENVKEAFYKTLLLKLKPDVLSLTIYGLSLERGEVCTFPSKIYERIADVKQRVKNGTLFVAVPYSFRFNADASLIEKVSDEIAN